MNTEKPTNQSWRALYPFDSRYATVDDLSYHYVDEGSGSPVVMVHGNPTWSFHFRDLIGELRASHRVIAPDHIGCGLSDKPRDYNYRLQTHIDNLEHLLVNHLDLKDINLVMHDWGGAIGTGFAVRHPQRVSRLVVMNTAAFLLPICPWRIRLCRFPVLGPLAVLKFNAFARAALTMATRHPDRFPAEVRAGYLAPYDCPRNRIAILRFVQDIPLRSSHPTWKTMGAIEKNLCKLSDRPMLICWGEQDFCFTGDFRRVWQKYFPAADVHTFDDAGHYVLEDAGEHIIPLIQNHLQKPAT